MISVNADSAHLILSAVLACTVGLAARRVRALSSTGAPAAALVGFLLLGFGGWSGAVALLVFFVTASALSRWRRREKERLSYEKGSERDAGQVLANGGIAALCALLLAAFPRNTVLTLGMFGALAAASADTWATEIGSLARRRPRMITTLRPAPAGSSGAVSLPGTLAALGGASLVALTALGTGQGTAAVISVAAGGFLGSLADSLLGATLQAQYRCPVCGALTERRAHCRDRATELVRGYRPVTNDVVNIAATLVGAIAAAFLEIIF